MRFVFFVLLRACGVKKQTASFNSISAMSQAFPVSCQMSSPTDAVADLTVLGTPVPVAHSTVRQKPNQRTFVLTNPNVIPTPLSPLEQSTVIVPDNSQTKETNSLPNPSTNDSLGILNIRSMKGILYVQSMTQFI